jgi:hypothetical protein
MKKVSLLLLSLCSIIAVFAQTEHSLDGLAVAKSDAPTVYFLNTDSTSTVRVRFAGITEVIKPLGESRGRETSPFPTAGGYKLWLTDGTVKTKVADVEVPDQGVQYIHGAGVEYLAIIEYDKKTNKWTLRLQNRHEQPRPRAVVDSAKKS